MVVFVAGQPASMKSTIERELVAGSGLRDPALIDADRWRTYHPDYETWAIENDLTAAARVQPAVGLWVDLAIEYVVKNRLDALVSATLKTPDTARKKIAPFAGAGYDISVVFTAVYEASSRLSVVQRYLNDRIANGWGRYVPPAVHDDAYRGVLDTASSIDTGQFTDIGVYVYRPDVRSAPQYTNQRLPNGSWSNGEPRTREAITEERIRQWNGSGAAWFRTTAQSLLNGSQLGDELKARVTDTVTTLIADSTVCLAIPVGHP